MAPEPKPGLVIRYDYLWTREAAAGKQQSKDRPACLVAASDSTVRPRFVVILPITHSAPTNDTVDEWPNAGIAPLPGRPDIFSYGFIPPRLFTQIRERFLELSEQGQTAGL